MGSTGLGWRALWIACIAVGCLGLAAACGGGGDGGTDPDPVPQGLQVTNHDLSLWAITRVGVLDPITLEWTYHDYALDPGDVGPVIPLQPGDYRYLVEYKIADQFAFTDNWEFVVAAGEVTQKTTLLV